MKSPKDLLTDSENALRELTAIERDPQNLPDGYVSPLVGDPNAIQWYRARRAVAFLVWEVYAAAAIKHYHTQQSENVAPLMRANGAYVGKMPSDLADRLEEEFLRCKEIPWKDQRPEGYSFDPFEHPWSTPEDRDQRTSHREASSSALEVLSETLATLSSRIEAALGHYWSAGAARFYAQRAGHDGGVHTDGWPLGVRKLMIYPSGAGLDKGSTVFFLDSGPTMITGGKGVWTVFENSLVKHFAKSPPEGAPPRPTIEVTILPAFRTDPRIKGHGIHVGFPWLPPEIDDLQGDSLPTGFTAEGVKGRTLLRSLLLAADMPASKDIPDGFRGLGYRDV